MKLKNINFKNDSLVFRDEILEFDDLGIVEVKEEVGEALITLPHFFILDSIEVEETTDSEPTTDSENTVVDLEFEGFELKDELEHQEEEKDVEIDYNDYSVKELKDLLDEKEIKYSSKDKKQDLIELLSE